MCVFFFFFKQKTAYEMRISDWSSDVCSSDLISGRGWTVPLVPPGLCVVSFCTCGDRAPPRPPFSVSSACHAHPDDRPPAVDRRADAEHDLDAVYRTHRTSLFHFLRRKAGPEEADRKSTRLNSSH